MLRRTLFPLFVFVLFFNPALKLAQDDKPAHPEAVELRECLILPRLGTATRSPVHTDPLEAMIVAGKFVAPKAGDTLKNQKGDEVAWYTARVNDEGWLEDEAYIGAYAFWTVEAEKEQATILEARGHSFCYVNGTLHNGDVYNTGSVATPLTLKKGRNEFLFAISRGRLKASVRPHKGYGAYITDLDTTLPDLVAGRTKGKHVGAAVVVNTTSQDVEAYTSFMKPDGVMSPGRAVRIPRFGFRKVPFTFEVFEELLVGTHRISIQARYRIPGKTPPDVALGGGFITLDLKVVDEFAPRKVTFVSKIDGSVQYYGVQPAKPLEWMDQKPGIVLSLHGAGVQASGQAAAYSPKSWCHIVCPTNRRPYGFDWEDWGRLDAMEVLDHAQRQLDTDPTKVWLTGHSMGGHGTWTVGSHFPDRFAAIAPSAGWESFWSYAGGGGHPEEFAVSEILTRAANPCRTLLRKYNYKSQGIYILHGDADDNVPVTEARAMRDALKEFHTDLGYYEQPDAGHWWDDGHDEGADCLDWAPIFDMFARRRLPSINEVQSIDFTTVCPEHSATCHWATIEMQEKQLAPSRVQISVFPNKGEFEGTTENVSRLTLAVHAVVQPRDKLKVRLDGGEIEVDWPHGTLHLRKEEGKWVEAGKPKATLKGPHRYGWFKNAFNHEFVYVYGTGGGEADAIATLDKARFDLEQWSYRANGSFDIVADADFDPAKFEGRNIILVGNADTNSAWDKVLKDCPLRVQQGKAVVGDRVTEGDDLAMLFVYPRAGTTNNCVGVIGGTGAKGIKLTNRIGYFISGASFPDVILYEPSTLQTGTGGVIAAGFLGEDWGVGRGEIVWRDAGKQK